MIERTVLACKRPKCRNLAKKDKRGLCGTCYNAAMRAIKQGRAEDELVREGKLNPKREKAIDWFMNTA